MKNAKLYNAITNIDESLIDRAYYGVSAGCYGARTTASGKPTMKKALIFAAAALFTLFIPLSAFFISRTVQNGAINNAKTQPGSEQTGYGNYDYSKQPYFDLAQDSGAVIYRNDVYFMDNARVIRYYSLSDLKDVNSYGVGENNPFKGYCLCSGEVDHNHGEKWDTDKCPGYNGTSAMFVLDAHESNGGDPVFYYCYSEPSSNDDPDAPEWELCNSYTLYRYDSGSGRRKKLCSLYKDEAPWQMMTYGDYIYLVVRGGLENYKIIGIDKNGRNFRSINISDILPELKYADDNSVYITEKRTQSVFRIDHGLSDKTAILDLNKIYTYNSVDLTSLTINGGYIYYPADFEYKSFTDGVNNLSHAVYNIYRTPLDDPDPGKGELVASDVYSSNKQGIYNNVLYYTPFDYNGIENGMYYNLNNGRLCAVDLETLDKKDIVSYSGLMFEWTSGSVVTDRFIISIIRPTESGRYDYTIHDASQYYMLYDFETGALYPVCGN